MSLREWPVAVVSTVVVAVVGVGLAYGVHALVGETGDEANPSANPSANPTANPFVNPTANPSPTSSSGVALGDDFCVVMRDLTFLVAELNDESFFPNIFGTEGSSETEALDALHDFGQNYMDLAGTIGDHLDRGAELVTDPGIATAFVQLADRTEGEGLAFGTAALDAASLDDFVMAVFAMVDDPEYLAFGDAAEAASPIVEKYVFDTCGIDLSGDNGYPDGSPAKTDASSLGTQFEAYYLDWDEGDPHAVITVTDGEYYLNGVLQGEQTPGVTITDQYAEGPEDWCVEVSSDDDPYDVYAYTETGSGWGHCGMFWIEATIDIGERSRPVSPSP